MSSVDEITRLLFETPDRVVKHVGLFVVGQPSAELVAEQMISAMQQVANGTARVVTDIDQF